MQSRPMCLWLAGLVFLTHPIHAQEPYRDLSREGAGFYGPGRELEAPDTLSVVRIGLTGPAHTRAGKHLQHGVALALSEANAAGGCRGLPYEIVFRPDDGPWGAVAQQAVRLAYQDQVWAIIGALDGERAHAAELVAAKAWVPVLTPGAGDRTIDYANVPWVFRCLPDDLSQAEVLLRVARQQGWDRLAVAAEATRDARMGMLSLRQAARENPGCLALAVEYSTSDPLAQIPRLTGTEVDAVLVWGRPPEALQLIAGLRRQGVALPVLAPSWLALPEVAARGPELGELWVAAPVDLSATTPALREFRARFRETAGEEPSYVALFAYDAARLLIAALEPAGLTRTRIRDELARISFTGLTGPVTFNSLGGRLEQPVLMALKGKQWVRP